MPKNRNSLMRIRTIDACLRRRNRLWTLEDLVNACRDALYEYEGISDISARTIRRDIQLMRSDKLGLCAPIVVKEKKYYTYEDPDFSITQMPVSEEDITNLSCTLDIIKHYEAFKDMKRQEDILSRIMEKYHTSKENSSPLLSLETNDGLKGIGFLGSLYSYIHNKEALRIRYRSFSSAKETLQLLSPYLLKEFNNRWFILGASPVYDDIRVLAIDRIIGIEKDPDNEFIENKSFDPLSYFGNIIGVTRPKNRSPRRVVLRVDAETAPYIITKPLHPSQKILVEYPDGEVRISLNLILNLELERLLLGYGKHMEVIGPRVLRKRIASHLAEAAEIYRKRSQS